MTERSKTIEVKTRIPELDGIRGIAISLVLVYHFIGTIVKATLGSRLSYALVPTRLMWSGVDLFFVLSGFLIGGILLDARCSTNYFQVFYIRRCFRILPVYWICLAGVFCLSLAYRAGALPHFSWMFTGHLPWVPYLAFLQNFWMAAKTSFGSYGLGATWSLAVEEQFYLTLPLLVRMATPRRLPFYLLLGIISAPALRMVIHVVWPSVSLATFVLMPCRADALLLGVLAAYAIRNENLRVKLERNRAARWRLFAVLLTGVIVWTIFARHISTLIVISVGYTWLAMTYVCLLLCGLLDKDSVLDRILRWRWLAWMGGIAYGTYLFHEFVLGFVFGFITQHEPVITNFTELSLMFLSLICTLGICRLLWVYFEKPLIRIGHQWNYRSDEDTEKGDLTEGAPLVSV
jgi:peptidoglycan/LPS O-acetylase OafA/YrhL